MIVLDKGWRVAEQSNESGDLVAFGPWEIRCAMTVDRSERVTKTIAR